MEYCTLPPYGPGTHLCLPTIKKDDLYVSVKKSTLDELISKVNSLEQKVNKLSGIKPQIIDKTITKVIDETKTVTNVIDKTVTKNTSVYVENKYDDTSLIIYINDNDSAIKDSLEEMIVTNASLLDFQHRLDELKTDKHYCDTSFYYYDQHCDIIDKLDSSIDDLLNTSIYTYNYNTKPYGSAYTSSIMHYDYKHTIINKNQDIIKDLKVYYDEDDTEDGDFDRSKKDYFETSTNIHLSSCFYYPMNVHYEFTYTINGEEKECSYSYKLLPNQTNIEYNDVTIIVSYNNVTKDINIEHSIKVMYYHDIKVIENTFNTINNVIETNTQKMYNTLNSSIELTSKLLIDRIYNERAWTEYHITVSYDTGEERIFNTSIVVDNFMDKLGGFRGTGISKIYLHNIVKTTSNAFNIENTNSINDLPYINITNINIPKTLEIIGDYSFYKLNTLKLMTDETTIDLPKCTSIGNFAFAECTNIKLFNLSNIEYIGTYSFKPKDTSIIIKFDSSNPPKIAGTAFADRNKIDTNITLLVPEKYVDLYYTAFGHVYNAGSYYDYKPLIKTY